MNVIQSIRCCVVLGCTIGAAIAAQAADVIVDCSKKNSKSLGATLATLDKIVPNTVTIFGACNELVVIERFRDLTLVGKPGASINDPTPHEIDPDGNVVDNDIVLSIGPQSNVTLRSLTVNGGGSGVTCFQMSTCTLEDVIVQGAAGEGVSFGRSSGSLFGNTIIRDNLGSGLGLGASLIGAGPLVEDGPAPQIRNNGLHGVRMNDNSTFRATVTIANNGRDGLNAFASAVLLTNSPVTGNGRHGVFLQSATLRSGGLSITGNTGNGVLVSNLSFFSSGGNTVMDNNTASPFVGQPDVNCASVTAATGGAGGTGSAGAGVPRAQLGGGTTNCMEPAP